MFGIKVKKKEKKDPNPKYRLINLQEFNDKQKKEISQAVANERYRMAINMLSPRQRNKLVQMIAEKRAKNGVKK